MSFNLCLEHGEYRLPEARCEKCYQEAFKALAYADNTFRDFLEYIAIRCSAVEDGKMDYGGFCQEVETEMQNVYVRYCNDPRFETIKKAAAK